MRVSSKGKKSLVPRPLIGAYEPGSNHSHRSTIYLHMSGSQALPKKLRTVPLNSGEIKLEVLYHERFVTFALLSQTNHQGVWYGEVSNMGTALIKLGQKLTLYHWLEFRTKEPWRLLLAIQSKRAKMKSNYHKYDLRKRTKRSA